MHYFLTQTMSFTCCIKMDKSLHISILQPASSVAMAAHTTELHKRSRGDIELNKKHTRRGCVAQPGPPAKWQKHGLVLDFGGNPAAKRRYFLSHLNPYVSMTPTQDLYSFGRVCLGTIVENTTQPLACFEETISFQTIFLHRGDDV